MHAVLIKMSTTCFMSRSESVLAKFDEFVSRNDSSIIVLSVMLLCKPWAEDVCMELSTFVCACFSLSIRVISVK